MSLDARIRKLELRLTEDDTKGRLVIQRLQPDGTKIPSDDEVSRMTGGKLLLIVLPQDVVDALSGAVGRPA